MIGILTEKPSAMRNFAKALGGRKGTFEGESFVLVHARGHLYEFEKPEKQVPADLAKQYKSWDISHLPWQETDFVWKRMKKKDTDQLLDQIGSVLSKCDEIVIATDDDPTGEGELLAWEILDELHLQPERFTRMYFVDESAPSIQKAFRERKPVGSMETDRDYIKALYRTQWDFLSMQWTRIATTYGNGKTVIRQGRLKSAMVKLVGDQCRLVREYKKVPWYQCRFKDENGNVFTSKKEPMYKSKEAVPKGVYKDSDVIVDSTEEKHQAPGKLLDLAGLSGILASRGIKAKDVLAQYQKMYEQQIVSYPRTEDKTITPEQFSELLPKIDRIADLVGVDRSLLTHRQPRTTHVKTGGAHGANRPGINVPASLSELEVYGPDAVAIYTLLAKNYLAMLAEDYVYDRQKAHLARYPEFISSTFIPKKAGFKAVFSADKDEEKDKEEGEAAFGKMASPFIHTGYPPKPAAPTMKWLMKQLEKYDVGTGATRTTIYADVTNSKTANPLLQEARGKLSMAPAGEISYALLPGTHIGDITVTEKLQKQMKAIAIGAEDPARCLAAVQDMIRDDMAVMEKNSNTYRKKEGLRPVSEEKTERAAGIWKGKPVSIKKTWAGHEFTDKELDDLFADKVIVLEGMTAKSGSKYDAKLKLEEQTYNGRKFVGPALQRGGFPRTWCKHVFTPDEKKALESGESIFIKDCVSKKGNTFSCSVSWADGKITPDFA